MIAVRSALATVLGLSLWACGRAQARPVSYKDGVSIASFNQGFQSDNTVTYSFESSAAVAARVMHFDDGAGRMGFYAPQVNFRLKRWNGNGYQANIYTSGAVGLMTHDKVEHSAIATALEADAESRQLYISSRAEKMWTGVGYDFGHIQARAGVAPYAAAFKQMATWLMVQYDYNPSLRRQYKITPLVRLFYRNYLFEAGSSGGKDWLLNFSLVI